MFTHTHNTRPISPEALDSALTGIRQRRMLLPALLFLVGHRPLAFTAGQALLLFTPLAQICGLNGLSAWASFLSQPDSHTALEAKLLALLETERPTPRGHA